MSATQTPMSSLLSHWALAALTSDELQRAFEVAELRLVRATLGSQMEIQAVDGPQDTDLLERAAVAFELAAIEGLNALLHPAGDDGSTRLREQAQAAAHRAFDLRRAIRTTGAPEQRISQVLHLAALGYCGDRWSDLRRWLKEHNEEAVAPSVADAPWDRRVLYRLFDCWVRLLRKDRWDDLDGIREIIAGLRSDQATYESTLLQSETDSAAQAVALRLIALYHWAKATELVAIYMLQGQPTGITQELDKHFESARDAALASHDPAFNVLLGWLHAGARRMVAGSVWWVAQAVNSRVTRFVTNVTKARGLFELLPPQRVALQEQGLLDQASRAIVVDLPTSGGKTVLAQFRILQALNQFDADNGWVAYVAPTRALVSQITRRLRSDFGAIGIRVEQLTSAVDIDSFEDAILSSSGTLQQFHVLVATPEKLHLVLRNKKISRPLALIVMDEAHNIEDEERGMRIELLLATVKRENSSANFLLLMPFVPNADALARWLAPDSGKTIRLGTTPWLPNERIVGMFHAVKDGDAVRDWSMRFETIITTPKTIQLHGEHRVGHTNPLNLTFGKIKTALYKQTASMAKVFSERGTSIAVARDIPQAWEMGRLIASVSDPFAQIPDDIALVQRFLATEISTQFELIEMLGKGIAVHHAGLSDESRSLIEWLAESAKLRVLCATTTIAQGINFPVSSVFLATRKLPVQGSRDIPNRAFWNLAGRAGRIDHDSVGVVGIAAGDDPAAVQSYVGQQTVDLISRLVSLLDAVEAAGNLNNLSLIIHQEQWADFRSYVAHLWNEKKNLDLVLAETEQLLRNTFGYGVLQARADDRKARALLDATQQYARGLAEHPENATLADSTGFSPEGVRSALINMRGLETKLTTSDWEPASLFGPPRTSSLPTLFGVMLQIPQLRDPLRELGSHGLDKTRLAQLAQAWVSGAPIERIATDYFDGNAANMTKAITAACKGIYRTLANVGTWGLAALSKMSGVDFDSLSPEMRRSINNLPAMLYHGVSSEAGIAMRINSVPRSIAERLGEKFAGSVASVEEVGRPQIAREFLMSLREADWDEARPAGAAMSGADYRYVWAQLSGEATKG
jgi:RAD3-like DEAD/DEAH box helicase